MLGIGDFVSGWLLVLMCLGMLAAVELWRWRFGASAEQTRKAMHAGSGLVCVSLPFLIESHWVVLVLASSMTAMFAISRLFGLLNSVHQVGRKTRGAEYFPLAIYLTFYLAHDRPWMYIICVLVLAISDSLAALIGKRYGTIRFGMESGSKSLEGSVAFLVATFLIVELSLVLCPDRTIPPPANCVLAALLVAVPVTALEVIAPRGTDNLLVPLGTYVLLNNTLWRSPQEIALQLAALGVVGMTVSFVAVKSKVLSLAGTLASLVFAYSSWQCIYLFLS